MGITVLALASGLDVYFSSENHKEILVKRFQDNFIREQNELDLRIDDLLEKSKKNNLVKVFYDRIDDLHNLSANRFMYFYIFSGDSMVFWSDNRIVEAEILPILTNDNQLLQLTNGWFYTEVRNVGAYKIIALLLIKNNYTIQNANLINNFNPALHLPKETKVKSGVRKVPYIIYTKNSKPVFSIAFNELYEIEEWAIWILVILYSISFACLIIFYRKLATLKTAQIRKVFYIVVVGLLILFLAHIMTILKFPPILYKLKLFQFQSSLFFHYFKSIGDIFVTSIICFFIFFNLYTEIRTKELIWDKNLKIQKLVAIGTLISVIIYFILINKIFEAIIYNTGVSFNIKDMYAFGYTPIFGILAVAILLSIFIFLSDYIIRFYLVSFERKYQIAISVILTIIISYTYSKNNFKFDWVIPLLILVNFFIIIYTRLFLRKNYRYIHIVFLVMLFSGYSVYTIYNFSKNRDERDEKAMAVALSSEHDPVAEYLIIDLNKSIRSDTVLRRKVSLNDFDYPWIYKYIRKKYFSGYWERYELQVTFCSIYDSLLLKPAKTYKPCVSFFNSIFQNQAEEILGTDFYFLKNANGHISYLSEININKFKSNEPINIYIQLDSKLMADELGYPNY